MKAIESTPIDVLLVEDGAGDVRLTAEAFREANGAIRLHVATDGIEALAFLRREGLHRAAPPDIILLDLNMPKMDGHELLALLKADESLQLIPTVIWTTSGDQEDIRKSYRLHANCFLTKPAQLERFERLVKRIKEFWLTVASLPASATRPHIQ